MARSGPTLILHERRGAGGAPRGGGTTHRLVRVDVRTGNVLARAVVERGFLVGVASGSVFWMSDDGLEARSVDALRTTLSPKESLARIPELAGAVSPCRETDAAALRFLSPGGAGYRVSLSDLHALPVTSAACKDGSTVASGAGKVDPAWLEPRVLLSASADGARAPLAVGAYTIVVAHESAVGPSAVSIVDLVPVEGGASHWSTRLPWAALTPSAVDLGDGVLVLVGQGRAAALDAATGALLWTRAP